MKKLTCIILTILMVFSSVTISPLYAKDANDMGNDVSDGIRLHPITISVETNKTNFYSFETAKITVVIKNEGNKKVEKISSECTFDDLQPMTSSSEVLIDNVTLEPGQQTKYSFDATLKPSKVGFFARIILWIKSLLFGLKDYPTNDYDDGRSVIETSIDAVFGSESVSDKIKTYYQYDVEEIVVESDSDYTTALASLTSETLNSSEFNEEDALNDEYYTGRIVVKSEKLFCFGV